MRFWIRAFEEFIRLNEHMASEAAAHTRTAERSGAVFARTVEQSESTAALTFGSHPSATEARWQALQQYMDAHVLMSRTKQFRCRWDQACRSDHAAACGAGAPYYEGKLPYVGDHYDLVANGHDFRVLIVGLESGGAETRQTLADRRARFGAATGRSADNAHWRGTHYLLRLLLGRSCGDDNKSEWLEGLEPTRTYMYRAFAFTNSLLCSAVLGKDSRRGSPKSRKRMWPRCAPHFRATVQILCPTVIALQSEDLPDALGVPLERVMSDRPLFRWTGLSWGSPLVAVFSHPVAWHPKRGRRARTCICGRRWPPRFTQSTSI